MTNQHSDSNGEFARWSRRPRTTPPVIDRRVLPNGEVEEWERESTIPDDFIYDPEKDSYYPPVDPDGFSLEELRKRLDEVSKEFPEDAVAEILDYNEWRALQGHKPAAEQPLDKKNKKKSRENPKQLGLFSDTLDDESA